MANFSIKHLPGCCNLALLILKNNILKRENKMLKNFFIRELIVNLWSVKTLRGVIAKETFINNNGLSVQSSTKCPAKKFVGLCRLSTLALAERITALSVEIVRAVKWQVWIQGRFPLSAKAIRWGILKRMFSPENLFYSLGIKGRFLDITISGFKLKGC